jgi:sortase A
MSQITIDPPAGPAGPSGPSGPSGPPDDAGPVGAGETPAAAPPVPPSRARLPFPVVAGITILATISGLALWALVFARVFTPLQEAGSQRQLHATMREQLAAQTGPIGGVIDPGAPVAIIHAPSIGLDDVVVVEGTSSAELTAGPGHRRDTPLPGQPGASVLMGRSELYGAPFARVADLHAGDSINAETGQGTFEYKVDGVRRDGDPLPAVVAAGAGRLTLVTSEPGADAGSRQVVYVDSTLVGDAQKPDPPASARPHSISSAEVALTGDQDSLMLLVIWLEALVAAVVLLCWGLGRWARRPALLIGIPLVIAALWGVSETATLLLPNLV